PSAWQHLASECIALGNALNRAHRWEEAVPYLRKAVEISERIFADFPARPATRDLRFKSSCALGDALKRLSRLDEADVAFRAALSVVAHDSNDALLTEAIHLCHALTAEFPANTHYQDRLATLLKLQAQHLGQPSIAEGSKTESTVPSKPDGS